MRHLIVGTAGHIDHGKSTLVHTLTGIDPDRLKEEKERGITIDLGFADLDLGDGRALSFVDVPGHERFVRHMVAGATGIDGVLLVIAADDGVRPQTREHVAICSLLGLAHGVIALTKSDLVEGDLREVVELEVADFVRGTFLEDAPVIAVSARTGDGLEALRGALSRLFDRIPERPAGDVVRLPIDRSFVLRGFGTVVTGTLAAGTLSEGDEVAILPGTRRARVRGVQVHRQRVAHARAGQRTAVNLQGVDRTGAPRGATLAFPDTLPTTRRLWGKVRLLPGAPEVLGKKGGAVRFHQGTCERSARMRVLGEDPGGDLLAELRLGAETVLLPGDRFILRRPAPADTVGGGVVLDVRPPIGRRRAGDVVLRAGDADSDLLRKLERAGEEGRGMAEVGSELGLSPAETGERARRLESAGRLVQAAGHLFDAAAWSALADRCASMLAEFHRVEPLRPGMSREELRSRLCRNMPQDVWRFFLDRVATSGRIRLAGDRVADASHEVRLSERDQAIADRIDRRLREAGLDPPDAAELLAGAPGQGVDRIVEVLVAQGRLVRIRDGRLFHAEALDALRAKLREHARTSRMIDVATFKSIAAVTRKNAIPLLEQLDAERTTRRVGNLREILAP